MGTPGALRPYVPRLAAEWISTRPDETARVVTGTLVSADISGFTRLTEQLSSMGRRGAEELTDLLNSCFDSMIRMCLAEGGDIIKFGGDALLVLFTGEGDAIRACRASHAMRALIAKPVQQRDGVRCASASPSGCTGASSLSSCPTASTVSSC